MTEQNQSVQETLSVALKNWIEDKDKSQSFVAKAIDISSTQLSQYLGGIYKGDNANLDKKVKAFLDLQQARAARKKIVAPFLETTVARRILDIADQVHEDGIMGVVVGPAGYGKSEGLKEFSRRNPDVLYLEIDQGYNALVLFAEIYRSEFGECGHKELHDMHVAIIEKMKGSGRMLIIDQAEYLPLKALEMLRSMYDKAGVGILLCGLERLLENIRGQRGQYAQLHSRIGVVAKLKPITVGDAKLIAQSMIGDKRAEKTFTSFYNRSQGNARELVKLINAAVRIAHINECHINEDVIASAEELVRV
jgi:DNA transposition AAA+ family ATPase